MERGEKIMSRHNSYSVRGGWDAILGDGKTPRKVGVTINGRAYRLPTCDGLRNKSIPADAVTSFDIVKTIQRVLLRLSLYMV